MPPDGRPQQAEELFGRLFALAQSWNQLGDRELEPDELTLRQWYLLTLIERFEAPPTLGEAARAFGSSHQNVRQMAGRLQARGLLELRRDPADRRVLRLHSSELNRHYWEQRSERSQLFIARLMADLDDRDLSQLHQLVSRLLRRARMLDGSAASPEEAPLQRPAPPGPAVAPIRNPQFRPVDEENP